MNNWLIYSVEDDEDISNIINLTLSKKGFEVVSFPDGESFINAYKRKRCDLVLLDLMLPSLQGKDVLKFIRDNNGLATRVIIVSAKSEISDKVELLDLGADDYLPKPFDLNELLSRVNAQLRRLEAKNEIEKYGPFEVLTSRGIAKFRNAVLNLTPSEYLIYLTLIKAKGEIVTREALYASFQGKARFTKDSKSLDMHIKNLRSKLGGSLCSVYGLGYRLSI